MHTEEVREKKRQRKLAKGLASSAPTPPMTPSGLATPSASTRRQSQPGSIPAAETETGTEAEIVVDAERSEVILYERDWRYLGLKRRRVSEEQEIRPSWRDINPLPIMATIFARPTNAIVLLSSGRRLGFCILTMCRADSQGILFAAQYTVTYTAAITLAA